MAKKRANRETENSPLVEPESRPSNETPDPKGKFGLDVLISISHSYCVNVPRLFRVGIVHIYVYIYIETVLLNTTRKYDSWDLNIYD